MWVGWYGVDGGENGSREGKHDAWGSCRYGIKVGDRADLDGKYSPILRRDLLRAIIIPHLACRTSSSPRGCRVDEQ